MNATTQRWCIWAGPALMVFFGLGFWVIAGMVPPPTPNQSAVELARFYADNQTRIKVGLVISMLSAGLAFFFPVVITLQMYRIEGRWSPMALVQLTSGVTVTLLFVFPMLAMATATYRPRDRDPGDTQLISDFGWLALVGFGAPAIVQTIAIAVAVFRDRRDKPVFPRWVGYFNIWCALLFMPGLLVICFTEGPFAYNGVLAFWIPLTVFAGWYFVMTYALLRAVKQHEQEDADDQREARGIG